MDWRVAPQNVYKCDQRWSRDAIRLVLVSFTFPLLTLSRSLLISDNEQYCAPITPIKLKLLTRVLSSCNDGTETNNYHDDQND